MLKPVLKNFVHASLYTRKLSERLSVLSDIAVALIV
jgi:hypothetical protein